MHPNIKDLTGRKVGFLVVLGLSPKKKHDIRYWWCRCRCGNKKEIWGQSLRRGAIRTCGCRKWRAPINYELGTANFVGKKFGQLTVTSLMSSNRKYGRKWKCFCKCGKETEASTADLYHGRKASCGCQQSKNLDLVGKMFGKLTVMKLSEIKKRSKYWVCECFCGKKRIVITNELTNGKIQDCGAADCGKHDITGKVFGRLTVLEYSGNGADLGRPSGQRYWKCKCQCGKKKYVTSRNLNTGKIRSCGCITSERMKKRAQEFREIASLKLLIELGKQKGYLTYGQVSELLPQIAVNPDNLDKLMQAFEENGIELIDESEAEDREAWDSAVAKKIAKELYAKLVKPH